MAKKQGGRSAGGTALTTKARSLSKVLSELGFDVPHTKALEAVSRLDGMRNRHAAIAGAASAADQPAQATTDEDA